MNLSENFTLEEMVRSQIALRKDIDNTPTPAIIENLRWLAINILEPVRSRLGVPLHTDSGYRSPLLNLAVGGAITSVHPLGFAADEIPIGRDLHQAFARIREMDDLPIDQCIIECNTWLHLGGSPSGAPRHEFMTASGSPGCWKYTKVS